MTNNSNSRNLYHPGRPGYAGPDEGWAGYVHHNRQIEYCWSFREHLTIIDTMKPLYEQSLRRECLTYLGSAPAAVVQAYQTYTQTRQRYEQAQWMVKRTWQVVEKTKQTYGQAHQQVEQARQAYEQARQTIKQAWQTASQAWQAVEQTERAALLPEVLADLTRLLEARTPEVPWDGQQLIFASIEEG